MDDSFKSLYNIDTFESLIWTERYNGFGNFEFYTPINQKILKMINSIQDKMGSDNDCYVWLKESNSAMIIEGLEITTDSEKGTHLIMSGRGLESILERRIIWDRVYISTANSIQQGVKIIVGRNIIQPNLVDRKINNFIFKESTNPHMLSNLLQNIIYQGDNLYDAVLGICDSYQMGFDVSLDLDNNFVFSLTYGEDRSYGQEKNPYVVFSPKYENIMNSDYLESLKTLKNVAEVAGEERYKTDDGSSSENLGYRYRITVGNVSGIKRRELFVDARDIQSEIDGTKLSDSEYESLLIQRGYEKLSENIHTKAYTGEIESKKMYVYGKDYFLGDIVQIVNEYGMESRVRVSEIVRVQDANGYSMYPTFQVLN